jgi:hypothetical protein
MSGARRFTGRIDRRGLAAKGRSEGLARLVVAPPEPRFVAADRSEIGRAGFAEYRRPRRCRPRPRRPQRIRRKSFGLLACRYGIFALRRLVFPRLDEVGTRLAHAGLAAAARDAGLDHQVLAAADQHQVLDIVAPHKYEPPRLVDLVIFADSQPHAAAAPHPALERPEDHQQDDEHDQRCRAGNEVGGVGSKIGHVGLASVGRGQPGSVSGP